MFHCVMLIGCIILQSCSSIEDWIVLSIKFLLLGLHYIHLITMYSYMYVNIVQQWLLWEGCSWEEVEQNLQPGAPSAQTKPPPNPQYFQSSNWIFNTCFQLGIQHSIFKTQFSVSFVIITSMMKNLGIESAKTEQERLRDVMKIEPRNVTELTEREKCGKFWYF